jgi:hypothetical protein
VPLLSYATPLSRRTRVALVVPSVLLAVASVAGCGGSSSKASTAAPAATGTPAAAGTTSGAAAAGANGFAAYTACLKKNGVTLPTGRPGGGFGARPSGAARGSRVPGGGFGGLNATSGPTAAAVKACASVRPTGGFGGGAGGGANASAIASQLAAYRGCLSDHGVTLPTAAPRPTTSAAAGASGAPRRGAGGFGGIGALNTADPKTAAAVKACAPLRPTFAAGAGGARTTPTPSATPNS